MRSKTNDEIKAKLPVDLQQSAQRTIEFLPYTNKQEETLFWSIVQLAYQQGRADSAQESLARHTRTIQSVIDLSKGGK